ncbi:MAG: ribonuclease P protein component [Phycisphaerae bacterium]|nr:ribonuclease P protein component [Phycisphaerae bacterium]
MARDYTLGREKRLRRPGDFRRVFAGRWSAADGLLVVYVAPNGLGHVRLGIPVGRKYGNAVRRNRVKRMIREAVRLEQWELECGYDLVCIPRAGELGDLGGYRSSVRRLTAQAVRRHRKAGAKAAATPNPPARGVV